MSLIMFQRRHYEKIAETLAIAPSDKDTIERFIIMFRQDNERFDALRFIEHFQTEYLIAWGSPFPHKIRSFNVSPNTA